jgi:8-oxo-dGTP diphosphatase
VAALLAVRGRLLLVHRSPTRAWAPSSWDVPGGHVEPGELETHALIRELREELAIEVDPGHVSLTARLRGPNFEMAYFLVSSWRGEPCNAAQEEHDELAWVTEGQLDGLVFADPAALDIIRRGFSEGGASK